MSNQEKYEVTKPKKQNEMGNLIEIKMVVTQGKANALANALRLYSEGSPVAEDLLGFLNMAAAKNNINLE